MHPIMSVEMMRLEHAARTDRLRGYVDSSRPAPAKRGRQAARAAMRRATGPGRR